MSEFTTDNGSAPEEGTVPGVAREGGLVPITELDFDERQEYLASMPDDERESLIKGLPVDVRMRWINEEREHLESIGARQVEEGGVEGAELGEAVEEVTIPGAEEPQDRAPDVGAELIAGLVKERMDAQRETAAVKRELAEAHDELNRYYQAFGPLPSKD